MRQRFGLVVALVAVLWMVEAVNLLTGHWLSGFGIQPRTVSGLFGIVAAPFLHGGLFHLVANTLPILILGGLIAARGSVDFIRVTAAVALFGGAAVWLLGRSSVHMGASGLVFGYFSYLLARGVVERSLAGLAISLVTTVTYGGLVFGLLPLGLGVSWESHVAGFAAGLVAARAFHGARRRADATTAQPVRTRRRLIGE